MNKEILYTTLMIIAGISLATLIVYWVGPDDVSGQEIMMCFATKELADDFLKQFPDSNVVIGCPEFNVNNQTINELEGK